MKGILVFSIVIMLACTARMFGAGIDWSDPETWNEWRLRTEDGVSLFVREFGAGDTVLVLHGGWGAEQEYLMEPFIRLADKYHFIFYDQRGSLRSPCPDSLISVANHIGDVERIRRAIGNERLMIVGHSMGGFLAMSYLERYASHMRGLVLVASAPARSTVEQLTEGITEPAMRRWSRPAVIDTLRANGLDSVMRQDLSPRERGLWHRITFGALNLHSVAHWRSIRGAFFVNQTASAIAALSGPQEWDMTDALARAPFPITVIHGDDDYLPLEFHREWIGSVPNATLAVIADAGHLCWIDQPGEFKRLMLLALRQ